MGQPHRATHTSALTTEPDKGSEAVQHGRLELYRLYGLILTWLQWRVLRVYVFMTGVDLCPFGSDLITSRLIRSRAEPGSMLLAVSEATEGDH